VEIVEKDFKKYLPDFMTLMKETSERNSFELHEDLYYEKLFSFADERGECFISIASFEGKILAIDFILISNNIANYIFGASSAENRQVQAAYLSHWQAMLKAQEKGLKFYNLGGVEDPERKIYKHWKSLTFFKQKWGGEVLQHPDFYDLVLNKFWYYLYMARKYLKSYK
jgi:lipid II:glycine glycyltransferase (peptidoglycan interpeptide bridge formation enzyme)